MFDVDSNIKIHNSIKDSSQDKRFSVLRGMKLFAKDIQRLEDIVIYKNEYEELGPSVLWKTSY